MPPGFKPGGICDWFAGGGLVVQSELMSEETQMRCDDGMREVFQAEEFHVFDGSKLVAQMALDPERNRPSIRMGA